MRQVLLVCMAAAATIGVASADETADRAHADRLFAEGRAQLAAGKPAQACDTFGRAIRLDPEASGTMLNLGLCNEVLGRLKTSLDWFRRAQIRATERNEPDYEREARERTIKLAGRVPTIALQISDPKLEARVLIDGDPVAPTDYGRIEVDPGVHVVEATAIGHRPVRVRFEAQEAAPGQTIRLDFVAVRPAASRRSRAPLYLALGGGALWVGATGLVGYEKFRVYDPARDDYDRTRDPEDRDRANRARAIIQYGGTGLVIAGAAALGVAAYLWFRPDREPRSLAIVPTLSEGAAGVGLVGRWP